jgi:hypothetical protein
VRDKPPPTILFYEKSQCPRSQFTAAFQPLFLSTSGVGVGGFIGPAFRHVKRQFEKKIKILKKVQNCFLEASPDQPSYACHPQKSSDFDKEG